MQLRASRLATIAHSATLAPSLVRSIIVHMHSHWMRPVDADVVWAVCMSVCLSVCLSGCVSDEECSQLVCNGGLNLSLSIGLKGKDKITQRPFELVLISSYLGRQAMQVINPADRLPLLSGTPAITSAASERYLM